MASTANSPDPKYRVKVYELNDEGEWADKGTGYVQFQMVQSVEASYVFVHSEVDSSLLLESKVVMEDDVYQRQGDTIISWNEPYSRQDLALSFAEAAGCQDIWEKLCAVRGVDPNADGRDEEPSPPVAHNYTIPPIESGNLGQLFEFLTDLSPFMREGVAATMIQEDYVKSLLSEFRALEEKNDLEQLNVLFMVVKAMIMMNETNLLEQFFSDECYMDVFGILEYDPDLSNNKPEHRAFFRQKANFKQVVPFQDPSLVTRIHQNFRIQYLKDIILPRVMDDATFGTLNSIIFFNSIEIVQQLQNDEKFLTRVFERLRTPITSDTEQQEHKDLLALVQEMCNLSKNLQLEARAIFFKTLHTHGIMNIFENSMRHPDIKSRLSTFDILSVCVSHDPSMVRVFMLDQEPEYGLLKELIHRIQGDVDQGIKGQAAEVLRQLLDPESMDQSQEKNQFLNTFYEKFLEQMIGVFSAQPTSELPKKELNVARNHVCELLTFFVQNHGYRIKYFVLRNNIVGKVCELMKDDEKYIALSAVRFVRACVGLKDEFYFRYMIKNNSFQSIIELFQRNGNKYNLLNSAIIDLFDFIRKENIKSLIAYTAEKFQADLMSVGYVDTFSGLFAQHEKNQALNAVETRDANDGFAAQEAEDVYYTNDADETATATPIVPYTESDEMDAAPGTSDS